MLQNTVDLHGAQRLAVYVQHVYVTIRHMIGDHITEIKCKQCILNRKIRISSKAGVRKVRS